MNEGAPPGLLPADTKPGGKRPCGVSAPEVPARRSPPIPDLRASDLVVEMMRTALDDQATASVADAPGGATPLSGSAPPLRRAGAEGVHAMSGPLDPGPLFALHGADFVRQVYLELLNREPDDAASFYTTALLEGRLNKLEILGEVRFSGEGKAVGRKVVGLKPRFLLSRTYRLPVVGRLVRTGVAVAGMPGTLRHLQRIEQAFAWSMARTDRLAATSEAEGRARAHGEAQVRARFQQISTRLEQMEQAFAALPDARALVAEAVSRQEKRDDLTDDAVVSLADRLDTLQADLAKVAGRPTAASTLSGSSATGNHSLDDLYLAFEDKFRGAREDIKGRQAVYLPLLDECGAGTLARPALDVGCGRGEWLELLRDRDLVARGVDLNEAMVELCRGLGLDAALGDAVERLREMPANSLGAVTGFHIIEHLPFQTFVRLLDESLRALASGGVILFETPNPDNLLVGSKNFYLDPTHRNPLPKEMTVMIAEARGFARAHARLLHPMGQSFNARDEALGERLDGLFYGPQDYALVAWKP